MNSNDRFTFAGFLNLLVIFCLIRFGLVMSAGFSFFNLTLVITAGAVVVLFYLFFRRKYCGLILRPNTFFLAFNILCIMSLRAFMKQESYNSTAANYVNQLIVLLLLWGFYLYLHMQTPKRRKSLTAIYLTAIMISTIYTFYVALNGHAYIIRNTAFSEYDSRFRFMYGGFDFIYGLVLIYAILLIVLTQGWRKIRFVVKIGMILMLLLIAATIIISSYSTAFALILVFTFLVAPKKRDTKIILITLFAFSVFVFPRMTASMIKAIPFMPELTSSRLEELLLSFVGEGSAGYITDEGQRLDRILWSLQAFFSHPLLGVFANNSTELLGQHTEWVDKLAMYGFIAAFCNTGFWVGTYRSIKQLSGQTPITRQCIVSAFVLYLILGFLNPISMVVTSAPLFILCPFAESLFIDEIAEDCLPPLGSNPDICMPDA